jgi:hypothetical protein
MFLVEIETFIISRNEFLSFLPQGFGFLFVNFRVTAVPTSLPVSSLGPQMLLQLFTVFKVTSGKPHINLATVVERTGQYLHGHIAV